MSARFSRPHLVVVKVGSSSLRAVDGLLDPAQVANLAEQVVRVRAAGTAVVVVSSGAVAAGMGLLGLDRRPSDVPTLQAAAAVGQGELIRAYQRVLAANGLVGAQLLLSQDDFVRRRRYLNARGSLRRLLELGAVPIVNENDAIATEELIYGDNDHLAALVASMLEADLLVMLSDVEGVLDRPPGEPGATRIARVDDPDELDLAVIGGTGSVVGSGGMRTKVGSAQVAVRSAAHAVVADARAERIIERAVAGEDVGTWFVARPERLEARRLWLAFALESRGRVHVDSGAARALAAGTASLLGVGVVRAEGAFSAGDLVELVDPEGRTIARGLSAYDAEGIGALAGLTTTEAFERLGPGSAREVVHRDDLVVLRGD